MISKLTIIFRVSFEDRVKFVEDNIENINSEVTLSEDWNISFDDPNITELVNRSRKEYLKSNKKTDNDLKSTRLIIKPLELGKLEESNDPLKLQSVTWTTPLGLPIVQPYRNFKLKEVISI